ncbi:MAG: right-handed parallel beta-helix repeat-containing protein [bacterium]
MQKVLRRRKYSKAGRWRRGRFYLFIVCALVFFAASRTVWGGSGDVAFYCPGIQGIMTTEEQDACTGYMYTNLNRSSKALFSGFGQNVVNSLKDWLDNRMADGKQDILVIVDLCPDIVFCGETDGSMAEKWMESGNMLIWTGSEPFACSLSVDGTKRDHGAGLGGAGKVLNVSSAGLCQGGGWQEPTTAVRDYNDPNGDYGISSFVRYEACHALHYDRLLIDSLSSDWHHAPFWRVDEIFAEDSENYQSDNIVLVNVHGGRYGQFYCVSGFNQVRMEVITQVLNNWEALPGRILVVPGRLYATIQSAIDAAQPRDTVLVLAGTYKEQLVLKRGIKLVSDMRGGGNILVSGPGYADTLYGTESKKVLARAQRTILDGTGFCGGIESKPMIDFPAGATVGTLVDGFTITHMPSVMPAANNAPPGRAHTVQMRGASGTIINCIICDNASSGIGSHALFFGEDSGTPYGQLDLRYTNIKYDSHPIVINNVVFRNEGNNLGNNHYAYAIFYHNECFESISVNGRYAPGIGCQHGAHALIVGNLVYKSAWVGIGGGKGEDHGQYPVNRPTHPTVRKNRVYDSGQNDTSDTRECGAGIGADDTGGLDPKTGSMVYHIIEGNYVNGAVNAAIGCRSQTPGLGHVKIISNEVTGAGRSGRGPGIGIKGAHALEISHNFTYANHDAGIGITDGGSCGLITNNEACENDRAGIAMANGAAVNEISRNDIHDNGLAGIGHDGISGGRIKVKLECENRIRKNKAAGIGIMASDVTEIRGNVIEDNAKPGITLIERSVVDLLCGNTLDKNGITAQTAGLAVLGGSSVKIRDTAITHSGTTGISALDEGTFVLLDNCTIGNNSQCGLGPNLTVQSGASATLSACDLSYTRGSPNIMASGKGTTLNMEGCTVTKSASPGLVASSDAVITIGNTTFDGNGTSGTRGVIIDGCTIALEGVTICNSSHHALAVSNCTGSMEGCEFYKNALDGGGQIIISSSALKICRNVLHDPAGYHYQIALFDGSDCKLYHNTIVGNSTQGPGPLNQGPGDGLYVDITSSADIRNNIFCNLPRGITLDTIVDSLGNTLAEALVTASSNCFYQIAAFSDQGIRGNKIIFGNPYLTGTFHLEPNSDCIDAAERIQGVNDVFSGMGPDIGAMESEGTTEVRAAGVRSNKSEKEK